MGQRILVTGGAGFIGSHVVDTYVAAGHDVVVVDNLSTGSRANLTPRARFYEADLRDRPSLRAIFEAERPEIVNHQAAQASVRLSMEDPVRDAEINILGSLSLLEECRRADVQRFIYAGTGGAAVGEPEYLPVDEDHPVKPVSPYGANKHAVEHYCDLYRHNYGIDTTILRYSNIYGPRQDPRGEAGVIAIFIGLMLAGKQPTIYGTGEQERDYVFVGDVARANLLALTSPGGRMYHIGTGVSASVNDLFAELREIIGFDQSATYAPALPGEVFKIMLTSDRAARELGWKAAVPLSEGLRRTVDSFRATKHDASGGA